MTALLPGRAGGPSWRRTLPVLPWVSSIVRPCALIRSTCGAAPRRSARRTTSAPPPSRGGAACRRPRRRRPPRGPRRAAGARRRSRSRPRPGDDGEHRQVEHALEQLCGVHRTALRSTHPRWCDTHTTAQSVLPQHAEHLRVSRLGSGPSARMSVLRGWRCCASPPRQVEPSAHGPERGRAQRGRGRCRRGCRARRSRRRSGERRSAARSRRPDQRARADHVDPAGVHDGHRGPLGARSSRAATRATPGAPRRRQTRGVVDRVGRRTRAGPARARRPW